MPIENNKTQLSEDKKGIIQKISPIRGLNEFTFYPAIAITAIFNEIILPATLVGKDRVAKGMKRIVLMSYTASTKAATIDPSSFYSLDPKLELLERVGNVLKRKFFQVQNIVHIPVSFIKEICIEAFKNVGKNYPGGGN